MAGKLLGAGKQRKHLMSQLQKYNVIYAGAVCIGFDEEQVKDNFVAHLKIPKNKVDRLFSGQRVVLKKSLDKAKAEQWRQKLIKIGAETAVIPSIPNELEPTKQTAAKTANKTHSKPVKKVAKAKISTVSQAEHDEEMEAKIRMAKAMILTQQMEQIGKKKESNPGKNLLVFSAVLVILIFFLYFYADSLI